MRKRIPVKKPKTETNTTILKLPIDLDNSIRKSVVEKNQSITAWFKDAAEQKLARDAKP